MQENTAAEKLIAENMRKSARYVARYTQTSIPKFDTKWIILVGVMLLMVAVYVMTCVISAREKTAYINRVNANAEIPLLRVENEDGVCIAATTERDKKTWQRRQKQRYSQNRRYIQMAQVGMLLGGLLSMGVLAFYFLSQM
ncbi:uncharacterized protein NEMAJ01_1505 [Nematocida major]|uniref:uncharacterized protein n=1 Tax=Nematocida major TaxID=1912982 RepID=UPI0020081BE1|nr:uncharacterized protein NEMAJ01_1505 [Nematocida major]KAH9386609.1 hypothetical protein NEMAJ01_1505 [Nematocida major]